MLPNLFWMAGHVGDDSTSKPGEPIEQISERQLQRQWQGSLVSCLYLLEKKIQKSSQTNK